MNEKVKFNINRLKLDFESVLDELVEEIESLNSQLNESVSLDRFENLQDDLDDKETELEKAEDRIEELEEEIEKLKSQIIINNALL